MNRRSFLGLGFKSVLLAAAITTGFGRTSLELIQDGPSIEEIISQTLRNRLPQLIANIESNNLLLTRLKASGSIAYG